ncbi:MAG: hypothetical protein ACYCZF_03885 [Anaerolineae bacterium]
MKGNHLPIILVITGLLGVGFLLTVLLPRAYSVSTGGLLGALWQDRKVDLAIHLGMFFVGALGIRVLLPRYDEREGQ